MNISQKHDWTFALSVDYRYMQEKDRIISLLAPHGLKENTNFSFFIDGTGHQLAKSMYNQITPLMPHSYLDGPGSYAHFCAFKAMTRKAKNYNFDSFLIVEDDLVLTDDFEEVSTLAWQQLPPDWDMLYYGANHTKATTEEAGSNLLRVDGSLTTHMVAFRSTIYDAVLSLPDDKTIDWNMAQRIHHKFKCFAVWPSVALQKPGYSQIWKRHVNYSHLWSNKGTPKSHENRVSPVPLRDESVGFPFHK